MWCVAWSHNNSCDTLKKTENWTCCVGNYWVQRLAVTRKPSWCCCDEEPPLHWGDHETDGGCDVDCLAGDETLLQWIHRWHSPHSDSSLHHSIMRWITGVEPFICCMVRGQSNSVMGWISAQICLKHGDSPLWLQVVCCSCTSCCWASLSTRDGIFAGTITVWQNDSVTEWQNDSMYGDTRQCHYTRAADTIPDAELPSPWQPLIDPPLTSHRPHFGPQHRAKLNLEIYPTFGMVSSQHCNRARVKK